MELFNKHISKKYTINKLITDDDQLVNNDSHLIYINDKDNKFFNPDTIGYIEYIIDEETNVVGICDLHTNQKFRGRGIATFLMIIVSYLNKGKKITLDDMSDKSRKRNNIYLNIGMKYEENYGPEMIGDCDIVYSHFERFKKKYVNKGIFC